MKTVSVTLFVFQRLQEKSASVGYDEKASQPAYLLHLEVPLFWNTFQHFWKAASGNYKLASVKIAVFQR
jgi:hypothetical protein